MANSSTVKREIGRIHDPKVQEQMMEEIAEYELSTDQTSKAITMIQSGTPVEKAIKKYAHVRVAKKKFQSWLRSKSVPNAAKKYYT